MNYNKSFTIIESNVRLTNKVKKSLELLEESLASKEIINPEFKDLKYDLNRFISEVYQSGIDKVYSYGGKYKDLTEELQYISSPSDVRGVNAYYKKMIKFSDESKESKMYKDALEITNELLPLVDKMKQLKDYVVTTSAKREQAKTEKETEKEIWIKKYLSHKDTKVIIALLEEKLEDKKKELEDSYRENYQAIVKKYLDNKDKGNHKEIFEKDIHSIIIMENFLNRKEKDVYKLKRNYLEIMENLVKYDAQKIINHFVYKNTEKLATIIYEKNNLESHEIKNISVSRGCIECEVHCKFKDESSFIAKTSLILSFSKYGKPFYRYPTIFQDVKLPGGVHFENPSEENMNKDFIKNVENKKLKL